MTVCHVAPRQAIIGTRRSEIAKPAASSMTLSRSAVYTGAAPGTGMDTKCV